MKSKLILILIFILSVSIVNASIFTPEPPPPLPSTCIKGIGCNLTGLNITDVGCVRFSDGFNFCSSNFSMVNITYTYLNISTFSDTLNGNLTVIGNVNITGNMSIIGTITAGNYIGNYLNITGTDENSTFWGDVRILGTIYGSSPVKIDGITFSDGSTQLTAAFGRGIQKYFNGSFNGSLYTSEMNSTSSESNSLFQVISDTRGTVQFQVQDGGSEQASLMVRSWIVVNQNDTLLNASQNNICSDWGFQHIDCNTSTTGADFGVTDDIEALGIIHAISGMEAHAGNIGTYLELTSSIVQYTGSNGVFNATLNRFCDYQANVFTVGDTGWLKLIAESTGLQGAMADYDMVINSSCIDLTHNPAWTDITTPVTWKSETAPVFIVNKGGFAEFYIGDSPLSGFKFEAENGTGHAAVEIDVQVGANSYAPFFINTNMFGFDGTIGQHILLKSSIPYDGNFMNPLLLEMDGTNVVNSEGVYIDMRQTGQGTNNIMDGIHMPESLNHLISVGSSDTLSKAYYNAVNVTINFTGDGNDAEIFIADDDVIYIGSNINFTEMGIALSTSSSHNLAFDYFYCDTNGVYQTLSGITDSTVGFKQSGVITFTNPANRGICHNQTDGTPFSDLTNYSYIALTRTANNVNIFPVVDIITIAGSAFNFILQDDLIKLNPTDTPEDCDASIRGGIYFDLSESKHFGCDGTIWNAMY